MDVTKPHGFLGFGGIDGPKLYDFKGSGATIGSRTHLYCQLKLNCGVDTHGEIQKQVSAAGANHNNVLTLLLAP